MRSEAAVSWATKGRAIQTHVEATADHHTQRGNATKRLANNIFRDDPTDSVFTLLAPLASGPHELALALQREARPLRLDP